MTEFSIQSEPDDTPHTDPLDVDPLGELTPNERGIWQYFAAQSIIYKLCFDDTNIYIQAYPDMASEAIDLPSRILQFANKEKFIFDFPEICVRIKCSNLGETVKCEVRRYGYQCSSTDFVLNTAKFMRTLVDFVLFIFTDAIASGFLSESDYPHDLTLLKEMKLQ